eukprot:1137331-Pelagomonas_calceolata.AAC.1
MRNNLRTPLMQGKGSNSENPGRKVQKAFDTSGAKNKGRKKALGGYISVPWQAYVGGLDEAKRVPGTKTV